MLRFREFQVKIYNNYYLYNLIIILNVDHWIKWYQLNKIKLKVVCYYYTSCIGSLQFKCNIIKIKTEESSVQLNSQRKIQKTNRDSCVL